MATLQWLMPKYSAHPTAARWPYLSSGAATPCTWSTSTCPMILLDNNNLFKTNCCRCCLPKALSCWQATGILPSNLSWTGSTAVLRVTALAVGG